MKRWICAALGSSCQSTGTRLALARVGPPELAASAGATCAASVKPPPGFPPGPPTVPGPVDGSVPVPEVGKGPQPHNATATTPPRHSRLEARSLILAEQGKRRANAGG